jgi:hypothetical protein
MSVAVEIRALVVTSDSSLVRAFAQISREFGIDAQAVNGAASAVPAELGGSKYEALLIDYETVPQSVSILKSIRESKMNRNAVVFAVVGSTDARQRARDQGATFVLERPLRKDETRRVLHAAYGLMVRERRRYFRFAVAMTVRVVRDSGQEVVCRALNISSNGMSVSTMAAFDPGETVNLAWTLPGGTAPLRGRGTVMWDDKHGKIGFSMECVNSQMQLELDSWLDSKFSQVLAKTN